MIDPLFIDDGPMTSTWSPGKRELSLAGKGHYVFSGEDDSNKVTIARKDMIIEIDMRPWTDTYLLGTETRRLKGRLTSRRSA